MEYTSTIDNWELFYDKRFGKIPYFATGREELTYDVSGVGLPYYKVETLRVYEDEHATFTLEVADPSLENWVQTSETIYSCRLNDVTFVSKDDKSIPVIHESSFSTHVFYKISCILGFSCVR